MTEDNALGVAMARISFEQAVICQIMTHEQGWSIYESIGITADVFSRGHHRRLIMIAKTLAEEGVRIDPVICRHRGGDVMTIDACLSAGFSKPSEENSQYMLSKLRELSRAREVYRASQDFEWKLGQDNADPGKLVESHLEKLKSLMELGQGDGDGLQDASSQHQSLVDLANSRNSQQRVWMGVLALDQIIDGLSPGEVLGIAARPGIGKTIWMGRYIRAVMDNDIGALMFSLEMPTGQIITRLVQPEWDWSRDEALAAVRNGNLTPEMYQKVFSGLRICDSAGLSVAQMEAMTKQAKAKQNFGLVLIDHLGLVGGHSNLRPYERVSISAKEVKDLAKRCEVAVVLAMQVSRDAGGDGSIPLTLSSTRDSGVTEEICDYLIGLHRPERSTTMDEDIKEEFANVIIARVLKNRHGAVGAEVAIHVNPRTLEWMERADLKAPRYRRQQFSE